MKSTADLLRRHRLPIISFITGFSLLTYELAAARVLAPSIGSSTYVWTGVIGVIIAALSLGFLIGGKVADQRDRMTDLVWLLMFASGLAALTLITYDGILATIVEIIEDNRLQAVVAALLLFAPTSFFIGMTSPYLAKLNVQSLKSTGQAVATLDMFNAIGGIAGTFITGFFLFGFIGSRQTIALVVLLLLAISWLVAPRIYTRNRAIVSIVIILTALTPAPIVAGAISIDTPSAHYKVINVFRDGVPITGLVTGPSGTQSAVYQNGLKDPVFWYAQQVARVTQERQPKDILVLGGGAFTLPEYFAQQLPDSTIDVVEIDPELETISREHFNDTNPTNVNEIFTDARTFVNQSKKQYDLIVVDVYGDTSIPFSLMTKEYGRSISKLVKDDGIIIANIIGGLEGECRNTFAAVDSAYRSWLPNAIYMNESGRPEQRANHLVIYSKDPVTVAGFKPLPSFDQAAYTDNYAPAERLYYDCQAATRSK